MGTNKGLKIGFDFDGVLCSLDTPMLIWIASYKNKEVAKMMEEWYYRDQKSLLDANLFLSDEDEMFIITGRPKYLYDISKIWVDKFYPKAHLELVGEQTMSNSPKDKNKWFNHAECKAKRINELELDVYFDDEPETINDLRKLCPNTKIIKYGGRVEL